MNPADIPDLGYINRPEEERRLRSWLENRRDRRGPGILLLSGPRGAGKRTLLSRVLQEEGFRRLYETWMHPSGSQHEVHLEEIRVGSFLTAVDCLLIAGSKYGPLPAQLVATIGRVLRRLGLGETPGTADSSEIPREEVPELVLSRARARGPQKNPLLIVFDDWQNANAAWRNAMDLEAEILCRGPYDVSVVAIQHYPEGQRTPVRDGLENRKGKDVEVAEVGPITREQIHRSLEKTGLIGRFPSRLVLEEGSWLARDLTVFWEMCTRHGQSDVRTDDAGIIADVDIVAAERGEIRRGALIRELALSRIRRLRKARWPAEEQGNVQRPLREALVLAAAMGEKFLPGIASEAVSGLNEGSEEQRNRWEDLWFLFLDGDEKVAESATSPLAAAAPDDREIEEDSGRRQWIYRWASATDRFMFAFLARDELQSGCNVSAGQCSALVAASDFVTDRLDRDFRRSGWSRALPFRIALAEARGYPALAQGLEDLRGLSHLASELPERIALAREKVGRDPGRIRLLVRLLNWHGSILRSLARPAEALPQLAEAHALCCELLADKDWVDTVEVIDSFASLHCDLGHFAEAAGLWDQVLALVQHHLGRDNPTFATILFNSARPLSCLKAYPEALSRHEESLQVRRRTLPPTHPDIAASLDAKGVSLSGMRQFADALLCHDEALRIYRTSPPSHDLFTAACLNNKGSALCGMQRLDGSLTCHREALQIRRLCLPPSHPHIGESLNNIGTVLFAMDNLHDALACTEEALGVWRQGFRPTIMRLPLVCTTRGASFSAWATGRTPLIASMRHYEFGATRSPKTIRISECA